MKQINIGVSARHVHLSKGDLEILFGKAAALSFKKELSQPGQFVTNEKVDLVGPKKSILGVSVLGPVRAATQVEISLTDARSLGVNAPIRESGDILGSGSIKLIGPEGEIEIKEGVIVAKRHIHMLPQDAEELKVKDKDIVMVEVKSSERSVVFGDVIVRVSPSFALEMHLDTDESNAAGLTGSAFGIIIK